MNTKSPMQTALALVAGITLSLSTTIAREKSIDEEQPVVQFALLLDTSSSMSGLISQAKTQLWKVVNEFIDADQGGRTPIVQVALYEYGKDSLSQRSHWIRQIQPLTRDLDRVSEELFALDTNGGSEFCGAVIERATLDLDWDKSHATYKAIFIAGNESFSQGPIDSKKTCKKASAEGIIVNTIHCGNEEQGIAGNWKKGAMVANGVFLSIDQNEAIVHIDAPQDKEIVRLNEFLNRTYLTYGGAEAHAAKANQVVQDGNAVSSRSVSARIACKASGNYWNGNWDLVDASKEKGFQIEGIKKEELPKEMQSLSVEERKAYVQERAEERQTIQKQILDLNREREKFVAAKRAADGQKDTVGGAIITAIRSQALVKSITFR